MKYRAGFVFFVGAVCAALLSLIRYPSLTDRLPMHWNLSGQVDRYGSKWEALLFMPIFLLVFSGIFTLVGMVGGKRLRIGVQKGLNMLSIAVTALFLAIHNLILAQNPSGMLTLVPIMLSGLMITLGFSIKDVEPNPFLGIRVPWTMKSPSVWRKTHDRASKLWIVGGVVSLVLALLHFPMGAIIGIFVVLVLYPVLDSYYISKSTSH